ncbi:hypothetical protein PMIN03_013071, partial [Paraphaeosphaeria minitans]
PMRHRSKSRLSLDQMRKETKRPWISCWASRKRFLLRSSTARGFRKFSTRYLGLIEVNGRI